MDETLILRIRNHAISQPQGIPFPPTTPRKVQDADAIIAFSMPPLLESLYLNVGNGGFGPGYGLIGLSEGYESSLGSLVEAYNEISDVGDFGEPQWMPGLLPFCEWGCNMYSCVSCLADKFQVYLSDEAVRSDKNILSRISSRCG